jgi:hypothetical protein
MLELIMGTKTLGAVDVELFKTRHSTIGASEYAVRYGLQTFTHMSLPDALNEYETCLRHALNTAGMD